MIRIIRGSLAPSLATLLIGALVVTGCMKEPELKANFGPEVSPTDFAAKLREVETPDAYTIKKGEYAYFIRSTVIQDQVYQLDKRWAYTVTNKTQDATDYIFTFVKEMREYDSGQEKISQDQSEVRLAKEVATTSFIAPQSWAKAFVTSRAQPTFTTKSESRITFHNLVMQKTSVPVPEFVQARADCGGLTPEKCRAPLRAWIMTFDQVHWDGNEGQKYSVRWVFSPDVPYFGSTMFPSPAGVIKACGTTQLPFQGQRVKVTQCDEIKDFAFGTD